MTDVVCYYHDPVKAPLLRSAVLPAIAGRRAHLERHWLHGPHLRICLEDGLEEGEATVAAALRAHLHDHPSVVDIPEAAQLEHSRQAGIAELILPPYEPFHPNNSVRIEPSDPGRLRGLLASDVLIRLRAEGLRLGVPAVAESLAPGDDSSRGRVLLAVTAMAVHAGRYPPGLRWGYHSFLSHLEDFLLASDQQGTVRARFDRIWAGNIVPVCELVGRVAAGHPVNRAEAAWQAWTIGMRLAAEDCYDRGELPSELNPRYGERAYEIGDLGAIRRYNYGERTSFSEYHTKLWTVDLDQQAVKRPLTVYRFATNILYQLLALCDVTPMERYLAASLVAQAAQRVTGENWADQLSAMAEVR